MSKTKKHFYHHLVEIDSIHIALDDLGLNPEEKHELIIIIIDNIHHSVLDTVLSELELGDKKAFLALMLAEDHDEIWGLLSEKVTNAEEKIKNTITSLIAKFHDDIKEVHKKKTP